MASASSATGAGASSGGGAGGSAGLLCDEVKSTCLQPRILEHVPLTWRHGANNDWEVIGKNIWLDETKQLVYFIGLKDTPLEQHLYVAWYGAGCTGECRRLTELGYSHSVALNEDATAFVTVFSNVRTPPAVHVYKLPESPLALLAAAPDGGPVPLQLIARLLDPGDILQANTSGGGGGGSSDGQSSSSSTGQMTPGSGGQSPSSSATTCYSVLAMIPTSPVITPEIFTFRSVNGHQLYGCLYRPPEAIGAPPGQKFPTVLFVYGGTQVQMVTNQYKGVKYLRLHQLATMGYAVVVVDGRGSCHRGIEFEGFVRHRMGMCELSDQIEGLHWVAVHLGVVDPSRVAVHGWSYGGYLALMAIAQRPDVFKVSIAGAPVTNWEVYDTGYTERYMGQPHHNQKGYTEGSVLTHVNKFPDEEGRLLIVHGLIDENVHFHHTSLLISALIRACKPYQLQVYPNERHGIRQLEAAEHYETLVLSFLQKNL